MRNTFSLSYKILAVMMLLSLALASCAPAAPATPAQTEARARLGLPEGFTCLISLGAECVVGSEFVGAI